MLQFKKISEEVIKDYFKYTTNYDNWNSDNSHSYKNY